MATLQSKLILSLQDQVTGRMRAISAQVAAFQGRMRSISAPFTGITARIAGLAAGYVGVTQGLRGTIGAAREQQSALTEIAIKAGMTDGAINKLRQSMTQLSPRVNQTTGELLKGVDVMVTMGLSAEQAAAAMPAIGKTATATMSSIDDLSAASVSAMQNFKVLPGEIARMLDGMAEAGNQGAFEMRDMAKAFPALTASAASLGIDGVDGILDMAAALQIARRGAGDAGTAANNMANFLQKIMSPEVAKRFKKFGVDTTKELQKAHKKGVSPIQHFIELVDEKTKGGQANLLGQLFGDKQVLEFVRPMLSDFHDYIRIRGDAEKASGTVADAYARRMQDANERIKAFKIQVENLGTSIGRHTLGPIGEAAKYLADVFDSLDSRVTVFHRLKAAAEGFWKGLGFESGTLSEMMKEFREFIFGVEDGSKAADQYGLIFKRFHEWGGYVREFSDAIKDNPVVKFVGEMSGHGFKLFVAAAGFTVLAGALTKLAKAAWLLSGAGVVVGIIKTLAGLGGAIVKRVPKLPKAAPPAATPPKAVPPAANLPKAVPSPRAPSTPGLAAKTTKGFKSPWAATPAPAKLPARGPTGSIIPRAPVPSPLIDLPAAAPAATGVGAALKSFFGKGGLISTGMLMAGEYSISSILEQLNKRLYTDEQRAKADDRLGTSRRTTLLGNEVTDTPSLIENLRRLDNWLAEQFPSMRANPGIAVPPTVNPFQQFLDGMDRLAPSSEAVPALRDILGAVNNPSGTQNVREINPAPRPNINVNVTVNATGMSPAEAVRQAGADLAMRLESSFSDGAFA